MLKIIVNSYLLIKGFVQEVGIRFRRYNGGYAMEVYLVDADGLAFDRTPLRGRRCVFHRLNKSINQSIRKLWKP